MKDELKRIAIKDFEYYGDMYKVIDYLNKSLSTHNLIFGLTEQEGIQKISIYEEK